MKILFKDTDDIVQLKKIYKQHYFAHHKEILTEDMLNCEILSVKMTKVDSKLIKKMPNLKWIINRSQTLSNINLKHCKAHNVGVVNIFKSKKIGDWIIAMINKHYCVPHYTFFSDDENIYKQLKMYFKNINWLTTKSDIKSIFNVISDTKTLILNVPLTSKTKYIINKDIFGLLPNDSNIINLSPAKTINNKDLLGALNDNKIKTVITDYLDSNYRQELLNSQKIIWTKGNASKTTKVFNYIKLIQNSVINLMRNSPKNIVLERMV